MTFSMTTFCSMSLLNVVSQNVVVIIAAAPNVLLVDVARVETQTVFACPHFFEKKKLFGDKKLKNVFVFVTT
jgi:hypothetical protein